MPHDPTSAAHTISPTVNILHHGAGGHIAPPRTTKRRTTTSLETKNSQNSQKIELYVSPTTKELKKKHSLRPVGGAEMGSQAERTRGKAAAGVPGEAADFRLSGPTLMCR